MKVEVLPKGSCDEKMGRGRVGEEVSNGADFGWFLGKIDI